MLLYVSEKRNRRKDLKKSNCQSTTILKRLEEQDLHSAYVIKWRGENMSPNEGTFH